MDGQKIQSKLVRTNSSLIRSNPSVKISIQNLSSIKEQKIHDLEEQKPHGKKPGSSTVQPGSTRLTPVLALLLLSVYTLFAFFNRDEIPTSENLLLALVFVAILLFFVSRNRSFVDGYGKRLNLFSFKSKNGSKPVHWLIGEADLDENGSCNLKKIVKEGVEFYNNGDFYEGEFDKGKCNGSGVYSYFVNGKYEGDWIDGKYDGFGIESWARGSSYKGQYRHGMRHGFGVYKFYTGDRYAGEWCNGQSHGIGVQSCGDGSCFVGEFKCGVKHGLGCYHFRNGDRYGGEYFGDKVHGFGVYNFANGHRYEGAWHEGLKQGYGIYTFRNGIAKCGEWNGGNLTTSLSPDNNAVVRALQSARKTAENAIQVRRVDEQVDKAVMAANRAATAARVAAVKAVQNQIDGKLLRH